MNMRKPLLIIGAFAIVAWAVYFMAPPQESMAQRIGDITVRELMDPAEGYDPAAIVCSTYVNNTYITQGDSHDYLLPVSGYSTIERVQIIGMNPNAAQWCSLGVISGTDSLRFNPHNSTGRQGFLLPATSYSFYDIPVKCTKVAVTNLRITDDFLVILYCKQ